MNYKASFQFANRGGYPSATFPLANLNSQAAEAQSYHLFCQALDQHNSQAWEAIYQQYKSLIVLWLNQAAKRSLLYTEVEDLLQETLLRFWCSIKKCPRPVHDQFPHTGALLKYLKRCATTTYLDNCRSQSRTNKLLEKLQENHIKHIHHEPIHIKIDQTEQLNLIHKWLKRQKISDQEDLVFHLSFEQGLSPSNILQQNDEFTDIQEVYRTKKRLLKRIQRALQVCHN